MKRIVFGILAAVLVGCHSPGPVNPPGNPPDPATTAMRGITIANGWGAKCGSQAEADAYVAQFKQSNCMGFETMEWIVSGDLATIQKQQVDKQAMMQLACLHNGKVFEAVNNSNDGLNSAPGVTTQTILDRLDYQLAKLGKCAMQPWSETASSHVDGNTVRQYAAKLGFKCSQYANTIGGGLWTEAHPCSTGDGMCGLPNGRGSWIVCDCTPLVSLHRDANGKLMAVTMREGMRVGAQSPAVLKAYYQSIAAHGASFSLYATDANTAAAAEETVYGGTMEVWATGSGGQTSNHAKARIQ